MSYSAKVYIVQRADKDGRLGEVIAAKLTHTEAHRIAKNYAPAKVTLFFADKTDLPNAPGYPGDQALRN